MDQMSYDCAEQKIADAFYLMPWTSPVPIETAVEGVLAYRRTLSPQERNLFDSEVERGRHPSLVVETLEAVSGRSAQRLERRSKVKMA